MVASLRVALVAMPFGSAETPSIQVGLLTAIAERAGFAAESHHLNLELAARLGAERYESLCAHRGRLTSEWLFAVAAFEDAAPGDEESYLAAHPTERHWFRTQLDLNVAAIAELRRHVLPEFVDDCVEAVDWAGFDVVGFSSTFQQHVASLALARRIKERHPSVRIVFGGANMEDEMGPEHVRAFPFIDYAVVGEGDRVFPELLRAIGRAEHPPAQRGLVQRTEAGVVARGQAPAVHDLESLPTPKYDECYERAAALSLRLRRLPFESSRGCWWGAKHHCTFCGLNGLGMGFRSKSPERVRAELAELSRKHNVRFFAATDNIIDMKYVSDLFGQLADDKVDWRFFYEVKANLSPKQVKALRRGGVTKIQPGIESMSTHVLKLMRKGATMLQNVRLLKWSAYYGVRVAWNLLHGFPGETEDDYRRQLDVLRRLSHLEPPSGPTRIWLERFSPYFLDRESFPVRDIRPEGSYAHVYPSHVRLDKVAYFFEYEMDDTVDDAVLDETAQWLDEWRRRWSSDPPDSLAYTRTPDAVFIRDRRGGDVTHVHEGPAAALYELCGETARTPAQLAEALDRVGRLAVERALERFCADGLMVTEDGRYLSLALPVNPNW